MNKPRAFRIARVAATAALLALAGTVAADDTEIFQGMPNTVSSQRPNILFIFDTSGSMGTNVTTQVLYDPKITFPGSCDPARIYFAAGNPVTPPVCSTSDWVLASLFMCKAGTDAIAVSGSYYANKAGNWRSDKWQAPLTTKNETAGRFVECNADAGSHGDGVDTLKKWARDGKNLGPWTLSSDLAINWDSNGLRDYTFYSANYLNWYNGGRTVTKTRLQIMQDTARQTIDQLAAADNVNAGLMRFDRNAEGGMVLREVNAIAANAAAMKADVAALTAAGNTPLSETLYEAYLYLSGAKVKFGLTSVPVTSVSTSRVPADQTLYKSPITISCQKTFVVLLTDGEPTSDNSADTQIQSLIGKSCTGSGAGRCMEEIAGYMYNNDVSSQTGLQNVTTYTIGFGDDVRGSVALKATAAAGGGAFYVAGDTASLSVVLTKIVREILAYNTSFTAPAVSVNAFNRVQNLNDLYITMFKPTNSYVWPGNLKKYRFSADGTILDANGVGAINPATGFFQPNAQSFWSAGVDGDIAALGGAASKLPASPADRKLYSNLNTAAALTAATNQVNVANLLITAPTLGLGLSEAPGRDSLINWLRGQDIDDDNDNGSTADARLAMGDPMHGRAATVVYGGTAADPDVNDSVVYAVTNEGLLHAISTGDGSELWAFVPQALLGRTRDLYQNAAVTDRSYGLDGSIRVNQIDLNKNGIIEPLLGDRVLIYFGMRRGGNDYYGLEVTDRNAPKFLWRVGPAETGAKLLRNAGQSWSTPGLAQVSISGATQNSLKQVLIFGGGYDTVQDNGPYVTDASGNQVFMIDAISGNVLWYAGPSADTNADLRLASMTHSIPADVRVVDITGDGFADRMYAADMGGRVWRFDIDNGQPRASLVTGGVFASLGNAHLSTHPDSSTRRFYNAPDVALLNSGGRVWLNVALGSGYRGHPLNLNTQDRFYALRDHQPFARLTQLQYNSATPITEADATLFDVTTDIAPLIPAGASGWRLDLRRPSASWTGEKSLSEARTVQNVIQFTTYEPNSESTVQSSACSPAVGTNRLYTVSAFTAAPVINRDNPAGPPDSADDRDGELAQGGIAPEVVWVFPPPDDPENCEGEECRPPPACLVGLENCGTGFTLAPVRTYWQQTGIK